MDLHSIMNSDNGGGGASEKASQPQPPAAPSTSTAAVPQTPTQPPPPPHAYREYGQSVYASSPAQGAVPSPLEYPHGPAPYASPTAYHPPPGGYASRPAPPPLQPPGPSNDPRSPGSASLVGTPYRHTPTSSLSATSAGYPFPPQSQPPPPSPLQRHQYGLPGSGGYARSDPRDGSRDSYGSQSGIPVHASPASYAPGQPPIPQTPPVGTPGGGSSGYLQHQRSQSIQSNSTSTPTSAHGQHLPPYGTPSAYGGPQGGGIGSPVATALHLSYQSQSQRQSSQPPTPLGPPLSAAPRQSSVAPNNANFPQPQSPFQPRLSSYPPHISQQQQQQQPQLQQQTSPPPPQSSGIQNIPTPSTHYDAVSESHRRSQSLLSQPRSDRERSVSVSPKTRNSSLPGGAGAIIGVGVGAGGGGVPAPQQKQQSRQRPLSGTGSGPPDTFHQVNAIHHQQPAQSQLSTPAASAIMDTRREVTPAKRKLDDRDLNAEEREPNNKRRVPPELNGVHSTTTSPVASKRKRLRYTKPPVWAFSGRTCQLQASRNYTLKSKSHSNGHTQPVNGNNNINTNNTLSSQRKDGSVKSEHISRHTSPEATRHVSSAPGDRDPNDDTVIGGYAMHEGRPFPLEAIGFDLPIDLVTKEVADFLFLQAVDHPNLEEIQSRHINIEIEAKLGTIISRDTDGRYDVPGRGEIVLNDHQRIAFQSLMTESQHAAMNKFLNEQVLKTTPHPHPPPHVPLKYRHRREIDRFFELPSSMFPRLPHALQRTMQSKPSIRARVTYDQKTGEVIAKIVKGRVADLHIFLPREPLDCRISVNLEWEWDGTVAELEEVQMQAQSREKMPDRNKDRLSYEHGFYQIDLTQVTQENSRSNKGVEKVHELEVELDSVALIDHAKLAKEHRPNKFLMLVGKFVDDIRFLARHCPPPMG